jgi:Trk-type K+ transport system membrane component
MRVFSRALARWDMLRVASITLGVVWIVLFGALVYVFTMGNPAIDVVLGAISALAIAGAGILYAWREPGA